MDNARNESWSKSSENEPQVWVAWSGGKDSALTLLRLRRHGIPIAGLLSTVVGSPPTVPFHGIPAATLRQHAQALGVPLVLLRFRHPPSDRLYARRLRACLRQLGCRALAFGDIFLEDVRRFREEILAPLALHLLFPLWGTDSRALADEVLGSGVRAVITCVDVRFLPRDWLGREYAEDFLRAMPPEVDPCGERGEFHTCVLSMPGFRFSLALQSSVPVQWAQHWHGYRITTAVAR